MKGGGARLNTKGKNMTLATLKERIANAEARIAKKQATIEKKTSWIAKKTAKLNELNENEKFWAECDIKHWNEDIERNTSEIKEIKASIETYKKQLAGETEKEKIFLKEIPEIMKRMQIELVEKWDAWDIKKRDELKAFYRAFGYTEFRKKYNNRSDLEFKDKTNEQIHKSNEQDAKALILDLYRRVKNITGDVTDWDGIHAEMGTWGFTVLNGVVIGKQGKCKVESIYAGGYNIQRLHIRVLTHEIN